MNSKVAANRCPECGAELPSNSPQGLCPKCLLHGVAEPTEARPGLKDRPAPPTLDAVRAAFPQLEIVDMIGQGGMGAVFKARQPRLNRFVALKILPASLSGDPAFADRFAREAQTLAKLHHPNVVTIHDFGQVNGFFYLLMEYVDGVNLRQAMSAGRFTPDQALTIVPMICDALQYAHDEGVLHRDIKPENILLDIKGRVRLVDFGIAKLANASAGPEPLATGKSGEVALTQTGASLGTPHYMAPEQQLSPGTVDQRADIYSLGVVFYELLTGELPVGRFTPPSRKTPVDPRIDEVVMRALAHQKEKRFTTAGAVKTAVQAVIPRPAEPMPAMASGYPVAMNWMASKALLTGFIAIDALMAYELINGRLILALWWRIMEGWIPALTTVTGLAAIAGVSYYVWQRRRWLLAPFEAAPWTSSGSASAQTVLTDQWLRVACLTFIAMLSLECVWMLLSGVLLMVQTAMGQTDLMNHFWVVPLALFTTPPVLMTVLLAVLLGREFARAHVNAPTPPPPWWSRAALCFLAFAVVISVPMPRSDVPTTTMGFGGFAAVGALAIVTRSRIWRAIALAFLTEMLVVGVFGLYFLIAMEQQETLPTEWLTRVGPTTAVKLATGLMAVNLFCYAAGLAALLLPSAAAAFGVPTRRRITDAPSTLAG